MIVSVVYGGTKEERGASEKNAKDIAAALKTKGYEAILLPFQKGILERLKEVKTDVVYLCVQGKGYGDGTFQAILEQEGIPFTGSRMRAAGLINDKLLCKLVFDRFHIATPEWEVLTREQYEAETYDYDNFGFPFVAKAPTQGGSFGIELIRGKEDIKKIADVFSYDDPILLERFIEGNFYTVGLYEKEGETVTLPVVEGLDLREGEPRTASMEKGLIQFTGDYGIRESKLQQSVAEKLSEMAGQVFKVTGARGYARVDFMVDGANNPYVLEINAVPGLKRASLMPREAQAAGIAYEDMIEDILKAALRFAETKEE